MKIPENEREALREHMGRCFVDAFSDPQERIVWLEIKADKKDARIVELEAALGGLYAHTKNNRQICGLNEASRLALRLDI